MSFLAREKMKMQPPARTCSAQPPAWKPDPRAAAMAHFTAQKTEVEYEYYPSVAGLALPQVREPCSLPDMAL